MPVSIDNQESDTKTRPPRVFVSYTHENPEHKRWVASLANDLCLNGIDAVLDQWETQFGTDLTLFMERGIANADRVLLICTPTYARKARDAEGGVGYERLVVTGEMARNIDTTKFVCVLRSGTSDEAIPAFATTRKYADFTAIADYPLALEALVRDIHNVPVLPKPSIGPRPFSGAEYVDPKESTDHAESIDSSDDIEQVFQRAELLLRSNDLYGWKQLVRNTRKSVGERLAAWRINSDKYLSGVTHLDSEDWTSQIQRAVAAISPSIVLSLAAIDSEVPQLQEQTAIIDDLLYIANWNPAGYTATADAPFALATIAHHIIGAMLIAGGKHDTAIKMLRMKVPVSRNSETVKELWLNPLLLGWNDAFGGSVCKAWDYMYQLWNAAPWLSHFFARERDFHLALRGYQTLAGLLELSKLTIRSDAIQSLVSGESIEIGAVPPTFFLPIPGTYTSIPIQQVIDSAIPTRTVLLSVAEAYGGTEKTFRMAWPNYYKGWLNYFHNLYQNRRPLNRDVIGAPVLP